MVTVSQLDTAVVSGIHEAAGAVWRVANDLYHEGTDFGRSVRTPLNGGEEWHGAGLAEAKSVVEADGLAVFTAVSRLQLAANTMRTFANGIGDCQRTLRQQMGLAYADDMTIDDDGTVDAGANADNDMHLKARQYEKKIKLQLRMAAKLDKVCSATLTRLTGQKADGQDGYDLPVYSPYAGGDLLKRSRHAYTEQYTLPNFSDINFAFRGSDGRSPGGFVLGPDMRLYPVQPISNYADRFGGGGWHPIATQTGFDAFNPPSESELRWARAAVLAGGVAGAPYPLRYADAEQTKKVADSLAGGGNPELPPTEGRNIPGAKLTDDQRTHIEWSGGRPTRTYEAPSGATRYAGGPELVANAGKGAVISDHLDDTSKYAYRTTYQQNDQGQVRAVVERYQVGNDEGTPKLATQSGYIDENGKFIPTNLDADGQSNIRPN